jgi:DNA polymerase
MRLIGAAKRTRLGRAPDVPRTRAVARDVASAADDWRQVLEASGVARPEAGRPLRAPEAPPAADEPAAAPPASGEEPLPPTGLVVGGGEGELFGGPIARVESVAEIARMVSECTRCPLYSTATNPVPGEGNPNADLVCVGEAPGATEDATGRPFVGQAGQLLTKILAAINLSREDVFICNVLKHRPPGNRNPHPDEVTACSPYLVRQVELIKPKVIVAFGTFAAQTLLNTTLGIGKLRGLVHRYHGIPVIVTYHPAALLRNPNWKRPTWEDVQLARRILDSASA